MTNTETTTFQTGTDYSARSACDHNAVWTWTVISRTAKFITITEDGTKTLRVGVKTNNGTEWALPLGSYSMAPTISADRL